MTLAEVTAILESSGLPVVYRAWPQNEAPPLPWICYTEGGSNNDSADGIAYYVARSIRVELYCPHKNPASEAAVEAALNAAGIFWQKTEETYIEDENCLETVYEFEV